MTIGVLGLGNLGRAVAERFAAGGRPLIVWNRTEEKAEGLPAAIAAGPADLVTEVDVVVVSLFDSDAAQAVFEGRDGLLAGAVAGKLVVDLTTHDARRIEWFAGAVKERGGAYIEAPVLGSAPMARRGMLTVLAGGAPGDFARALPLLEVIGRDVIYLGRIGEATRLKLINNLVLAGYMAALGEALALGERLGLTRERVIDVLGRGAGNGSVLNSKKGKLEADDFSPNFSVNGLLKDLRYIEGLAEDVGRPLVAGRVAHELYEKTLNAGQGEMDYSVVYETFKA